MRILTILFLLMSLLTLGGRRTLSATMAKFYGEIKEKVQKRNSTEGLDNKFFEKCDTYWIIFICILILIPITIAKIIYMCFAISYDPFKYVAIGFLAYKILRILLSKIRSNKEVFSYKDIGKYTVEGAVEQLDKTIITLSKFRVTVLLDKLISLSFYGYMFYIFFIR